jgi:uncharacterized repeat protein (TIGR01451 family)
LALDSYGAPHIAYSNGSEVLEHAYWDGDTWIKRAVGGTTVATTAIALDAGDTPHIVFAESRDEPSVPINYARWTGNEWAIQTAVSSGSFWDRPGLALDLGGLPHISHEVRGDLKYARLLPPLLLRFQVAPANDILVGDSLTYTITASAPGLEVEIWNPLPDGVTYVPGTLKPASAVYSATARAISWRSTLGGDEQSLEYQVEALGEPGEPMPPVAATAWLYDRLYGRTTSATVIANGLHMYLPATMKK